MGIAWVESSDPRQSGPLGRKDETKPFFIGSSHFAESLIALEHAHGGRRPTPGLGRRSRDILRNKAILRHSFINGPAPGD